MWPEPVSAHAFKISVDVSNTRYLKKEATSKNPAPKNFTKNFKILKEIQI